MVKAPQSLDSNLKGFDRCNQNLTGSTTRQGCETKSMETVLTRMVYFAEVVSQADPAVTMLSNCLGGVMCRRNRSILP